MKPEFTADLSVYTEVEILNEQHRVTLVRKPGDDTLYVKKTLSVYNPLVYHMLMEESIPGCPRVYAANEENGALTVIEQYLRGTPLDELLSVSGAFSEERACRYITELCNILGSLHHRNPAVVHRDIKPSNIIITPDGHLWLIDFNGARIAQEKSEDTVLFGTPGYAAPEQYGFGASDVRTDIFAVGRVLNTMLWGRPEQAIYPNSRFTPTIERCTKMDRKDRFSDIFEVLESLRGNGSEKVPVRDPLPSPITPIEIPVRDPLPSQITPIFVPEEPVKTSSLRRFLPPGFRTGKLWKMLSALSVYAFITWVCLNFHVENASESWLTLDHVGSLATLLLVIFFTCNYLNVHRHLPLTRSDSLPVRIFGVLLYDVIITAVLFWAIIFVEVTFMR